MTQEQFVYWLQGFFELSGSVPFTKREQMIKDHLQQVFLKKTPVYTTINTTGTVTGGSGCTVC